MWVLCAAITHKSLRDSDVLADPVLGKVREPILRREIIAVTARFARPQRKPVPRLLWSGAWRQLWRTITATT